MRITVAIGLRLFGAMLVIVCASANVLAIEATWIGGPAGSWTDGANWSIGMVPASTAMNVTIDDDPAASSAVTLGSSLTIGDVTVDAGDQLIIESGATLTPRFVTVDGDLVLQAAASLRPTEFLWIQPNGHLSMTDNPSQSGSVVQSIGSTAAYWNQGRISGAGAIGSGMPMFNEGFIVGDIPGETLTMFIHGNSNSNIGEMLATGGGTLWLRASTSLPRLYNSENGEDGLIQARGANSTVRIENVAISGGEISTAADESNVHGTVMLTHATLSNVRLEGNIVGNQIILQGNVENNATVNFSTSGPQALLYVVAPSILTGTGRMEMNRFNVEGGFNLTYPDPSLINDINHTIAGAGNLLLSRFHFTNRGTVEAHPIPGDAEMSVLLSTTQTMVNSGRMRATDQATLSFVGTGQNLVLENYEGDDDGVVEADINSTVRFGSNLTIRGGVLRSLRRPRRDLA